MARPGNFKNRIVGWIGLLHAVRVNLILIQPHEIDDGDRAVLTDDRARHIRKVLKAEPDKRLRIGLLNGCLGSGTVVSIDRKEVVLDCVFEAEPPPKPSIDVLLAMPRPKAMKRLWAQLASLGVGRIVLLRADKVERCYFDSHVIEPDFYNKHLIEGLQQARCTHLPTVQIEPLFKPYIEDRFEIEFADHRKLLADPSGTKRISEIKSVHQRVLLAVGPEGGWTPYELEMLAARGFELIGMGDRILRTDTATIGLLSVLHEHLSRSFE